MKELLKTGIINRDIDQIIKALDQLIDNQSDRNKLILQEANWNRQKQEQKLGLILEQDARINESNILQDLKKIAQNYIDLSDLQMVDSNTTTAPPPTEKDDFTTWATTAPEALSPVANMYKGLIILGHHQLVEVILRPSSILDEQTMLVILKKINTHYQLSIATDKVKLNSSGAMELILNTEDATKLFVGINIWGDYSSHFTSAIINEIIDHLDWEELDVLSERKKIEPRLINLYLKHFQFLQKNFTGQEDERTSLMIIARLNHLKQSSAQNIFKLNDFVKALNKLQKSMNELFIHF